MLLLSALLLLLLLELLLCGVFLVGERGGADLLLGGFTLRLLDSYGFSLLLLLLLSSCCCSIEVERRMEGR